MSNQSRMMWVMALVVVAMLAGLGGAQAQPVLSHMGNWDAFDPNSEGMHQVIEEATGYQVEYTMLPVENANEVLSLRVSSPGAYDSLKMNVQQFNILTGQNALIPLDDLLHEHGQRIIEVIGDQAWEAAKVNGEIYGVPEVVSAPNVNHVILARKDILDELDLEVPQTVDDFRHVLQTIREEKNMLPLAMAEHNVTLSVIASGFGIYTPWIEQEGELINQVQHPRMPEYLEFMASLYADNLIDQDFPVNQTQQVQERFASGRAAMMPFAWWQAPAVLAALEENVPGSDWVVIPPLMDEGGNRGIQIDGGVSWFIGIPRGARHAEDVVKWWNAKLEFENHRHIALGEEGVHYYEEDGAFFPILPQFEDERDKASWYLTGVDEEWYPQYWAARVRKNHYMSAVYDDMQEFREWGVIDPMAWAPALPTVARYTQSLGVLMQDTFINYIAGAEDLDDYDMFLQQWEMSGGLESVAEANEWFQSK